MPTITIKKQDLDSLLGKALTLEELEESLMLVKGEAKDYNSETGDVKIELADSNRPDLWCAEGIARQIHSSLLGKPPAYPFFEKRTRSTLQLQVSQDLHDIRPFVGAFAARAMTIDEEILVQLIQTQEKLSDIFGRKRQVVSIGYYRLGRIAFPVSYTAVKPHEASFVPLGFTEKMTLAEILKHHPKGQEFGHLVARGGKYPLLMDREGKILSFPPIINSREVGEVQEGEKDLLVEATGTDLRLVILVLNILAANLCDRGGRIEPVTVLYPYPTTFGRSVQIPFPLSEPTTVALDQLEEALGEQVAEREVKTHLTKYGYRVAGSRKKIVVTPPPWRGDVMHVADVIEDFAISRGYGSFRPLMPSQFTVGGLSAIEQVSDKVRELLVGCGFTEVISNILTSQENGTIHIDNLMSSAYSTVRQTIIPSLLKVEAASSKAFYPHRIFEVGEVAEAAPEEESGCRTLVKAGCLLAHAGASFSELHSFLDLLFYYLGRDYTLVPVSHPAFMEGRAGKIMMGKTEVGMTGEIRPGVLEGWKIGMPCSAFEITLDRLLTM